MVETWNNGKMGYGMMQYLVNDEICVYDKIKTV
jgi:hypothetical protein